MLLTIDEFCQTVEQDMNGLIDELTNITGRANPAERQAWQKSLPKLSRTLARAQTLNSKLGNAHLSLGRMTLEYKLPAASAWCDAVLIGKGPDSKPQVVIIELKDWMTQGDEPGDRVGLILHKGSYYLHPSDQVKGYTLYCRRFHSAVLDYSAQVDGCVFFTNPTAIVSPYRAKIHQSLVKEFPLFSLSEEEKTGEFAQYLSVRLQGGHEKFARDFKNGIYKQDRNILKQVASRIKKSEAAPFVLLDEQRKGFHEIAQIVNQVSEAEGGKHVIIVEGPPGSGKSALAANLWIDGSLKHNKRGNIVFVTTSSSQRSNWQNIFDQSGGKLAGIGFVKTSNSFNPGLTGQLVSHLRTKGHDMDPQQWEENLKAYEEEGYQIKVPDDNHFLSIVDEAHALINPEGHSIGFASGWVLQAGPQAHHIIRASKVSVFLLDGKQSYRDNETTTINDIIGFANKLGAQVHRVNLSGHQFRCGGSKEYVEWLEGLLASEITPDSNLSWRKTKSVPDAPFTFDLISSPFELEEKLRSHHQQGATVRLLSSYSVEWATKKVSNLDSIPKEEWDFRIPCQSNGKKATWYRPWNFAPNEDYSFFIQASPGSRMHKDPLAEVGCPYVVRGFDYDYLGLLWLEDLVYRNGKWIVQSNHVQETALSTTKAGARSGKTWAVAKLEDKIKLGYRILMTRSLKGMYLYVHDKETREYLSKLLNDQNSDSKR